MRILATAGLAGLLALAAAPVLAAPFCTDNKVGISYGFSLQLGNGEISKQDKMDFAKMALRQRGVDATRVETWNGCLRAWVRQADGTEQMEFFHPSTLERVY